MGTGTTVTQRTLGYAAPNFGNKPLAEAAWANIKAVGMPQWTTGDQTFAKSVQQANGRELKPLAGEVAPLSTPDTREKSMGGGSDDIGDVMWTVPTITVRYPSNIPNMIGHNVLSAIAMATPIAHKGAVQGAKAVTATIIDLVTTPSLIAEAKTFQQTVQFKDQKYDPVLTATDQPATHLNADLMERMRPKLKPFYYDPAKHRSYLEQIKVAYPEQ